MPRCLIATADLMGYSRFAQAARAAGLEPKQVRGAEGIRATHRPEDVALVVDLGDAHGGPDAVAAGHALGLPVFAVGPHVQTALLEAARAAGATRVLAHSAAPQELPKALGALAGPPGVDPGKHT